MYFSNLILNDFFPFICVESKMKRTCSNYLFIIVYEKYESYSDHIINSLFTPTHIYFNTYSIELISQILLGTFFL